MDKGRWYSKFSVNYRVGGGHRNVLVGTIRAVKYNDDDDDDDGV